MKQITAIIEHTTLDEIQEALPDGNAWIATVSTVRSYEGRDVATRVHRGVRSTSQYTDRLRLEFVVADDAARGVTDWIALATRVGMIGPCRVSVTSVDEVLDIHDGVCEHAEALLAMQ